MNENVSNKLKQEPKTWYYKVIIALIVAGIIAWSSSTVEIKNVGSSGLGVAANIIKGIFTPDTKMLFNFTTAGVQIGRASCRERVSSPV